jgi:HlyD family secretion protein
MRNTKLLLLFLLPVLIIYSCGKGSSTTHAERKDLTQAVYASGKLYPLNDYKVFSKYPGYIKTIHIKVGDSVSAGQPLVTIRNDQTEFNTESAKNAMELAMKNASQNSPLLQSMKNEVSSSRAKYELDSMNFNRYQALLKQNAGSQLQYDQAKVQYEVSKQNYQKALNNYQSTKDRVATEAANAELQYKTLLANKNEYVIMADKNGLVYDIDAKVGEMVSLQKPVMEIGDANKFELELNVDETDITLLKTGQQVVFTIDAYGPETFNGKVREIYPRISQSNKTSKVVVDIIQPADKKFYSSLSAEANIIISTKKNVLVIPREYIIEGNKVKLKGKDQPVIIKKGIEDLENVEVIEGIKEEDEIVK